MSVFGKSNLFNRTKFDEKSNYKKCENNINKKCEKLD